MTAAQMKQLVRVSLTLTLVACGAAACSSDESRIYDAFKCGKAATLLGHRDQASAAVRHAEIYLAKVQGSKAQYAAMLGQKFSDEFELDRMALADQLSLMSDLYTSSRCKALYE